MIQLYKTEMSGWESNHKYKRKNWHIGNTYKTSEIIKESVGAECVMMESGPMILFCNYKAVSNTKLQE